MRLDLTSFAFGFSVKTSAGNPNWATSLGQGNQYKINPSDDVNELLKGMVHLSVPLKHIQVRIGKGGKMYYGDDPTAGILLGSVFEKVFVNGNLVCDCRFVLVITRDMSKSHFGRLRLKYSPHNLVEDNNGKVVSNETEIQKIRNALGLSVDACWFVYDLKVIGQDQLHLAVAVPNGVGREDYKTNDELHAEWRRLIPAEEYVGTKENTREISEASVCNPFQVISLPPNVDRLSVALKLFAEKRSVDKPSGWSSYDDWTKGVRTEFVAVDEVLLDDSSFDYLAYIRKFGISWQVANTKFAAHSDEEKRAVLKFLKGHKDSPKSASWYIDDANRLVVNGNRVKGMSQKAVLYFMSELHPEEFAAWTEPTYEQLEFLGLHKGAAPSALTIETYEDCKAKQQLIVAKMKELRIGKASDDPSAPDYRTANEFLWWLGQDDNKNLIKENVMNKAMKKDKPTKYVSEKELVFSPDSKDDELLLRLLASLRAKPFAILAGHSGTGKSRYVKKLAYMTCNVNELRGENQLPGNYLLLQVKPNWHDSTDLLGFRNAMAGGAYQKTELIKFLFKAYHFSETPFFLCLDEMNLAPVEQYFAEFLSAMESKEPVPLNDISENDANLLELGCEWEDSLEYLKKNGFSIPKNLFIVGTVNMDETTNQFSRKVLDRAFTIEMTDVDFTNYGKVTEPSYHDTIKGELIAQLLNGEKTIEKLDEDDTKEDSSLVKVQKALASTPFAIAYRFANEYMLLKRAIECFDADGKMKLDALDQAVLMKILPRIAGERDYIEKVYGEKENVGLRGALVGKTVSLKKIEEILKRAENANSQYITFWP